MSELMLVGVLKLIARNEELERMIAALQEEIQKLKVPPKENEGNEDG